MTRLSFVVAAVAFCGWTGCGLVDPDITNFRFVTDDKEFTIDTADWGLVGSGTVPSVPCQQSNDLCMAASDQFCMPGQTAKCTAMCSAQSTCALNLAVSLSTEIKLADDKEFQAVDNQPLAAVTIETVEYRVIENTLDVDSPVLDLYIGPLGTMTPDGAGAEAIGQVESVPAGVKLDFTPVTLNEQGNTRLSTFIEGDGYKSPFNIIMATTMGFAAGDRVPSGRARIAVHIKASARPSL